MNKKILLIDDDEMLLSTLTMILEMHEYDVVSASTAEEGMQHTKQSIPDLIITDYKLPQMTGIDFAQQVQSDKSTAHIPIVLLTGLAASQIENLPSQVALFAKPFEISDLIGLIDTQIHQDNNILARN